MAWPFAACLVLTGVHVYLGIHVVARKVIFVDLALAQIAALGTAVGIVVGGYDADHDPGILFGYSFAFSGVGALLLTVTRTRTERVPHEAIIGIVYAVAFAAAIVLLHQSATGVLELKRNLEGNILNVTPRKVLITAGLYAMVGLMHVALRRDFLALSFHPETIPPARVPMLDFLFYLSFGFVITSSVAMAGVFLVFSYLVIPSVGAMLLAEGIRARLLIGWGGASAISLAGCYLSWDLGLPTSPLIVVLLGAALAAIGIVRRLVQSTDRPKTLLRMAGVAGLFGLFAAGVVLMGRPEEDPFEQALHQIHSHDAARQVAAIGTFARHPERRADWIEAVRRAADDPDRQVRQAALGLLGLEATLEKLASRSSDVREDAIERILARGDASAVEALMRAGAQEPEEDLKIKIYETVLELGSPEGIGPLIAIWGDARVAEYLREQARHSLEVHLVEPVTDPAALKAWWEAHRGKLQARGKRFIVP